MAPSPEAGGDDADVLVRRNRLIADLGRRALQGEEADWLLHDAAAALAEVLDASLAAVFERTGDGGELRLREGVGWRGEETAHRWASAEEIGGPVFERGHPLLLGQPRGEPLPRCARELLSARTENEVTDILATAARDVLEIPVALVYSYDEEGREFFDYVVEGAQRMREMIRSLLDYSQVSSRGRPLRPTDATAVLEDVLADLELRIEETGAEVTAGQLPEVLADPDQLGQVFRNLVANGLQYSGEEAPRVHVDAEREDGMWRFSVRDDGIGIPQEHTERIFEVFRRLEGPVEASSPGVGLAICQHIVGRHGGRLWVESERGEGSTFHFTIPAIPEIPARLS